MPNLSALDDAMLHPGRLVPAVNRLGGGSIAVSGLVAINPRMIENAPSEPMEVKVAW